MTSEAPPPPGPLKEATLCAAFEAEGIGLHTGRVSKVRVSPAPEGHGRVFRRVVGGAVGAVHDVPAIWTNRRSRPLCTALQAGEGPLVRTVEHILAALSAHAIDNALIEIEGEELPIFDGSAEPWCARIRAAGRVEQGRDRRYLKIVKRVRHHVGMRKQTAEPAPVFEMRSAITLSEFGQLSWQGRIDAETFDRELAVSRSFGRMKWALLGRLASVFRREPVLRGASSANVAALVRKGAVGGLRFPDEPVRHRALDVVGDLALAGLPIVGRIVAIRPGHEANYALLEKLMTTPDAWEIVTYEADGTARKAEA